MLFHLISYYLRYATPYILEAYHSFAKRISNGDQEIDPWAKLCDDVCRYLADQRRISLLDRDGGLGLFLISADVPSTYECSHKTAWGK